ncbi:MAG: LuxR family transcriptional regulator [Pseudomonadota bacterium]
MNPSEAQQDFADLYVSSRREASEREAFGQALGVTCAKLGFSYFSYIAPDPLDGVTAEPKQPLFISNYPGTWESRYLGEAYHTLDPVVQEASRGLEPFRWGSHAHLKTLSRQRQIFFSEAREFGIANGITIPIHGQGAACAVLSVSCDLKDQPFEQLLAARISAVRLLAAEAFSTARTAGQFSEAAPRLSKRELECLYWTAQGKTGWEISVILGRSLATVNFHLQNVTRKLSADNKVHAVVIGLRQGLIDPAAPPADKLN